MIESRNNRIMIIIKVCSKLHFTINMYVKVFQFTNRRRTTSGRHPVHCSLAAGVAQEIMLIIAKMT